MKIILVLIGILIIGAAVYIAVMSYLLSKIPEMSVEDMLSYTTKNKESARITVGIIKDGKMSYEVYGKNGEKLETEEYDYEIGSVTKTFNASLLSKAISEGKVDLEDTIDQYLNLPEGKYYPSLQRIVTHTAGYKGYYFTKQMVHNFLHRESNDFYGIDKDTLLDEIANADVEDKNYEFKYSNFGIAVIGLVLEEVYGDSYTKLMSEYIQNELGLSHTCFLEENEKLSQGWRWKAEDAYKPAGALISNISDMLRYVQLHMTNELPYLSISHKCMAQVNATTESYERMGIRLDEAGICWIRDEASNTIWHNGGTGNYNSYVAFDEQKQIGVVVLSNLAPGYKIPATVIGAKLIKDLQEEE